MARAPVKQFKVGSKASGDDFDKAEIDALIYRIALWFGSDECDRQYGDPVASATEKVQECLLAQKADGSPWTNCPQEFDNRVKAKCAFDLAIGKGISIPRQKGTNNGKRTLDPLAQTQAAALAKGNPVAASFDAEAFRVKAEKDILDAFPELDNPAHRPNVRSLTLYYSQREVIDQELAAGVAASKREMLLKSLKLLSDMADDAMKQLGVHPDQVRKKISGKAASTISDLVAMLGDDDDYKKREKTWALQLALQLYWMSAHYNGRKTGPQVQDFEIWHLTRSRPMTFTCRHGEQYTLIEGFEPNELRDYLVAEGVLVEEPVLPICTAGDLKGLATEDLTPKSHDDTATSDLEQDGNHGSEETSTASTEVGEAESGRVESDPGVSGSLPGES